MFDELETPSRENRIFANALGFSDELYRVCEWLRAELRSEISKHEMFAEWQRENMAPLPETTESITDY